MKRFPFYVDMLGNGEWEVIFVPTYENSRFIRNMKKLNLISDSISGMCPRSVHLAGAIGPDTWVTMCHEVDHYVRDYLTAPFPKDLTHPVRSLWGMRKGYRNSKREIRAYRAQRAIADGLHNRIRPAQPTRLAFGV